MRYYNLLILFMITLKCRAAEESATIKNTTVEEYSNNEAFNASTSEGKLVNSNRSSEPTKSESTSINDSDDDGVDIKGIDDGSSISRRLVQQGTRMVEGIGSFINGIAQLKETDSKDNEGADRSQTTVGNTTSNATNDNEEKKESEESTTANCSTDENSDVSNARTTKASENAPNESTQLPNISSSSEGPVAEYMANANTPLTNKEFGKLPIPKKTRHRTRKVVKIIGSLLEGLARLNEPDSDEDEGTDNEVVMNVINSEVFNAVTTKAPENIDNKWTQLPNINSSTEITVIENTLIKATVVNNISPFTNKEFGKLPIPTKPRQRTRTVTSIIGSLIEGLARLNEPDSEEDEEQTIVKDFTVNNVTSCEVFDAITTEAPENIADKWTHLPNSNSLSATPIIENTLIKATVFNGVSPFKNKEFGKLPIPNKPRQRTQTVVKIIGILKDGLARLNEPYSVEDAEETDEETTIVNFTSVENVTGSEVFKATTTKAPKNFVYEWTQLPNNNSLRGVAGAENTLIKGSVDNAVSPFKNKEIGKLPIPKIPRQRTRNVVKIIGSLMEGLTRLKELDSDEDAGLHNEDTTPVNCSKVENVTNSEVYNASTTEAPNNLVDKWALLANTNSLSEPTVTYENTLMHATNANVRNPFKEEIGKLPIPIRLPQQGSQLMKNIIGSFVKGLVQGTDAKKDED